MRKYLIYLLIIPVLIIASEKQDTKNEILTVYNSSGNPTAQSQTNKGWHRVAGNVTLSSGRATVTLNTSLSNGKNDISFISKTTFCGQAWSLDTTLSANKYTVFPLSGTSFLINSSNGSDNTTVYYLVEGQ